MSGVLLEAPDSMLWFLVPHTVALLLSGCFLEPWRLRAAVLTATLVCVATSVLYMPLGSGAAPWMLALLGVAAAPLSVQQGVMLHPSRRPALTAAIGLAAGNLLALGFALAPIDAAIALPLVSLPLLAYLVPWGSMPPPQRGSVTGLWTYLPFVLCFQIISGLMYGGLLPAYAQQVSAADVEVLFYAAGALTAAWLFTGHHGYTLLTGVFAALLAFALWQLLPAPWGAGLGMLAMMLAAGVIDLFVLAWVLSFADPVRAYGVGVGILCSGIVLGRLLAMAAGEKAETLGLIGLVVLNLAVLVLYLPWRNVPAPASRVTTAANTPPAPAAAVELPAPLPAALATLLSEQERQVAQLARTELTYREIAQVLAISESSIKTYMQRIYRKTGVVRRHQLRELLNGHQPDA